MKDKKFEKKEIIKSVEELSLYGVDLLNRKDVFSLLTPYILIIVYIVVYAQSSFLNNFAWIMPNVVYYTLWGFLIPILLWNIKSKDDFFKSSGIVYWSISDKKDWIILFLTMMFFFLFGIYGLILGFDSFLVYLPFCILYMVANPLFEELYWRSFLFGKFKEKNWVLSAINTSFAFAIFHFFALGQFNTLFTTPLAIIATFLFSLIWCWQYYKTKSIFFNYVSHMFINFVAFLTMSSIVSISF